MHTGYLSEYLRTAYQQTAMRCVWQLPPRQRNSRKLIAIACVRKFLASQDVAMRALSHVLTRWYLQPVDVLRFNPELVPRVVELNLRFHVYHAQGGWDVRQPGLLRIQPARRFCSSKKFPMSRRTLVNLFSLKRIAADGDRRNHQD